MDYGGPGGELKPLDYNDGNLRDLNPTEVSSYWVPNTTSPKQDGNRLESIPDERYDDRNNVHRGSAPFSGQGSALNPKESSESIASQKFDNLSYGSSSNA
jgi:hypothetical protein